MYAEMKYLLKKTKSRNVSLQNKKAPENTESKLVDYLFFIEGIEK